MYDIVKTKVHNGIMIYYAVGDTDEDGFILDLTNLEKSSPEKSLPAKIIKLYDLKYFDIKNKFIPTGTWSAVPAGLKPVHGHIYYPSPFRDVFSPPPNRLLS
jgi:hypothetical protein